MEKWRIAMGELTDFVLAGSSFGGYVSSIYASKYH
jgi:enterochelin esterase-like enzyme